jgi:hypothetical protein
MVSQKSLDYQVKKFIKEIGVELVTCKPLVRDSTIKKALKYFYGVLLDYNKRKLMNGYELSRNWFDYL